MPSPMWRTMAVDHPASNRHMHMAHTHMAHTQNCYAILLKPVPMPRRPPSPKKFPVSVGGPMALKTPKSMILARHPYFTLFLKCLLLTPFGKENPNKLQIFKKTDDFLYVYQG